MAKASDKKEILHQNLNDAGCNKEIIAECMNCSEYGDWIEILNMLANHKKNLLDVVHSTQNQIDCLDYLTYKIRKENMK